MRHPQARQHSHRRCNGRSGTPASSADRYREVAQPPFLCRRGLPQWCALRWLREIAAQRSLPQVTPVGRAHPNQFRDQRGRYGRPPFSSDTGPHQPPLGSSIGSSGGPSGGRTPRVRQVSTQRPRAGPILRPCIPQRVTVNVPHVRRAGEALREADAIAAGSSAPRRGRQGARHDAASPRHAAPVPR